MKKEELIVKLTKLYETGKDDMNFEMYEEIKTDQTNYIEEMAENIIKSFELSDKFNIEQVE